MSRSRIWLVGGAVAALVALLAGWLFVVSPQRAKAADLNSQADQIGSANAALVTQIAQLKRDFANLPATQAQLRTYSARIPSTAAMSSLLRQLSAAATASHVTLTTISPSSLTAMMPQGSSSSASAKSTSGLLASSINITLTGHYAAIEAFLTRIEGLQRAFLVTGLSLSKATSNGPSQPGSTTTVDPQSLQVSITGRVFVAGAAPILSGSSSGASVGAGKSS